MKRHKEEIHVRKPNEHQCEYCRKLFQRKMHRDVHSEICRGETNKKVVLSQNCHICGQKCSNKSILNRHIKNKHKVMIKGGSYMIVSSKINKYRYPQRKKEYICYNCPILKKFHTSWDLRRHRKIHIGTENLIRSENMYINRSVYASNGNEILNEHAQ